MLNVFKNRKSFLEVMLCTPAAVVGFASFSRCALVVDGANVFEFEIGGVRVRLVPQANIFLKIRDIGETPSKLVHGDMASFDNALTQHASAPHGIHLRSHVCAQAVHLGCGRLFG